ncbi:metallophosphoesterase family protein [Paenibacillus massiliensis]|uniref:metallophosphoesterase family protein n=1 Tax=Paenibacillus massiliensis TaxID=225917 RepID=UPI000427A40F|nr:metallophosphoesterase family protein [Paenibacillus massiliensis]
MALNIVRLSNDPLDQYPYINAGTGGTVQEAWLPILHGTVTGLPTSLDALIVASDLQGIVSRSSSGELHTNSTSVTTSAGMDTQQSAEEAAVENTVHNEPSTNIFQADLLLGEVLPAHIRLLLAVEFPNIRPERAGVLLCGDLYAQRGRRGASGDPLPVWLAFRQAFNWVIGVDGNHDLVSIEVARRLQLEEGIQHIASPSIVSADQLQIAGVGGIIGRQDKPNRMDPASYLRSVRLLLQRQPDVLLLHQSPGLAEQGLQGEVLIHDELVAGPETVVFCGHTHWDTPMIELSNGTKIVNVDSRLLILTREL